MSGSFDEQVTDHVRRKARKQISNCIEDIGHLLGWSTDKIDETKQSLNREYEKSRLDYDCDKYSIRLLRNYDVVVSFIRRPAFWALLVVILWIIW